MRHIPREYGTRGGAWRWMTRDLSTRPMIVAPLHRGMKQRPSPALCGKQIEVQIVKTDTQLQKDVQEELSWEPSVTASEIGVAVSDGVVTLAGTVPTYAEKFAAQRAARRVLGVKAIAEDLKVKVYGLHKRNDTEIAEAAAGGPQATRLGADRILATVENGWITLRGQVSWGYQRDAAFDAVRFLPGMTGVSNDITIKPTVQPYKVKDAIEKALKRDAEIDAENIVVRAAEGTVTLSGRVRSWAERDEAGSAAWSTPGVATVQNELSVSY